MFEARGVLERRHIPVQITRPSIDAGVIVADHAAVGLEQ